MKLSGQVLDGAVESQTSDHALHLDVRKGRSVTCVSEEEWTVNEYMLHPEHEEVCAIMYHAVESQSRRFKQHCPREISLIKTHKVGIKVKVLCQFRYITQRTSCREAETRGVSEKNVNTSRLEFPSLSSPYLWSLRPCFPSSLARYHRGPQTSTGSFFGQERPPWAMRRDWW